jgi:hypothetical protein
VNLPAVRSRALQRPVVGGSDAPSWSGRSSPGWAGPRRETARGLDLRFWRFPLLFAAFTTSTGLAFGVPWPLVLGVVLVPPLAVFLVIKSISRRHEAQSDQSRTRAWAEHLASAARTLSDRRARVVSVEVVDSPADSPQTGVRTALPAVRSQAEDSPLDSGQAVYGHVADR